MAQQAMSREKLYRNLALLFLACLITACVVPMEAELAVGLGTIGAAGAGGFALAWLFAKPARGPEAPDLLPGVADRYFERDGLCFASKIAVCDGLCWFHVYFQNRYDRPCRGTLYFVPLDGMSRSPDVPSEVLPVVANFECAGGEAAVMRFPYLIAARWQGKIMLYDVAATVERTGDWGAMVRSRAGSLVRGPNSNMVDALRLAAVLVPGFAPVALVKLLAEGPRVTLETCLPQDVADRQPADVIATTETLWSPELTK